MAKPMLFGNSRYLIACLLLVSPCSYVKGDEAIQWSSYGGFTNDNSQVFSGGLDEGFTSRILIDSGIEATLNNHTLFASIQIQRGKDGSADTGDAQAYSNIDEANFARIYELYYAFSTDSGFIRLGKHDANGEFAFTEHGGGFINSSMGFSPTIFMLPTYPTPALSLNGGMAITESITWLGGVYAAESATNFDEQFYITELQFQLTSDILIKTGYWRDSNPVVSEEDTLLAEHSDGIYAIFDNAMPTLNWLDSSKVSHFIQAGYTSGDVSEIDLHLGTGLAFEDVFSNDGHQAGIGITAVRFSEQLLPDSGWETALEIYWQIPFSEHFTLQPDLQIIQHPSGDTTINNAWVFTLRIDASVF